ncbi:MAG TPA: hypothetical protein VF551_09295, partial [Chthoniobacterales bacterium]
RMWQEQITPAKLQEIFATFIEQQLDLSAVATVNPVFAPAPKLDSDGLLVLEGTYPTSPSKVLFRLKYVYEKPAWKLLGIKLDVKPAGAEEVKLPSETEIKALVRDSLLRFNEAVQAKSFVGFHKQVAALWQKQITPEKLQSLFQVFIEQKADISPVAKLEPTFVNPPAIDEDGLLQVEGFYPTKPNRVRFKLGYLFETPEWRLIKINVKVSEEEEEANAEE